MIRTGSGTTINLQEILFSIVRVFVAEGRTISKEGILSTYPPKGCGLSDLHHVLTFPLPVSQELEEDPDFQQIVRTKYGQRPPIPVSH